MRKSALESTLLFAVLLFTSNTLVASVISTFDIDDDGWTVTQITGDGSSWGGQWPVSWSSGYIYKGDVGSGGTLFSAPSKFLGDKSAYIGGSISFDFNNNSSAFCTPLVCIISSFDTLILCKLSRSTINSLRGSKPTGSP